MATGYCFIGESDQKVIAALFVADRGGRAWRAMLVNEKGAADPEVVEKK